MNRVAGVGLAAFAVAVVVMARPSLLPFPVDRVLVYLVGFLALVQAYRTVGTRRYGEVVRAETGDPEVAAPRPVPGEDVREVIGSSFEGRWFFRRSGLREAAVAVLTRYEGLTEDEARTRVNRGTWTDDPFAAAHLGEDAPPVPLGQHVRRIARLESSYTLGRTRAIAAIAAVAGVPSVPESASRERRFSIGDGDSVREVEATEEAHRRATGHWRAVSVVALAAVAAGVFANSAPVVLSGVAGVGFAAYARAATLPPVDLHVERSVETDRPDAGEPVEVRLRVRNEGDHRLPDLRLVDGVPPALSVVSGSPRLGTTLAPGESVTLTYCVEARRGVHEFGPVTVLARDLAGSVEESRLVPVETTLTCVPSSRPTSIPVPLRTAATPYAGRVQTPTGGEGVEFHSTRAYQPGDPASRIDWNRRARTGELATLEFREERAATVVVVVDARAPSYVAHDPHGPHAVDRAADAAGRVVESLLDSDNQVGVAAFGTDCWLPPGTGREQGARARSLLATDPAFSSIPPRVEPPRWRRRFERRLPSVAQVVVLSPLTDARSARLIRRLEEAGHPVTVLSPDPTVPEPPGPLLATVARRVRITDLRGAGIPVLDWLQGDSLDAVLARSAGGSIR